MSKVSPYITRDIYLDGAWAYDEISTTGESGLYCVFWWREIPLGQLFIERQENLSNPVLLKKILDVIQPTIDYYAGLRKLEQVSYREQFLGGNRDAFNGLVEQILKPFLLHTLP